MQQMAEEVIENEPKHPSFFVVGSEDARKHRNSSTQLKHCVDSILSEVKKYNLDSVQLRYVFKRVREQSGLVLAKKENRLPDFMNAPEIYMLLETAMRLSAKHRLLCEVLIMTGLRINELRNLDIRDIDFNNNQLKVMKGKGNKQRYLPITNSLLHKIDMFVGERKTNYLFISKNNKQYSLRMMQHMVETVIHKCNLQKHLSTHSLRHTFACMCLAKGMSLEKIQLLMGHSSFKTTEIYARMELSSVKEEYLKLMGDLN